MTAPRDHSVYLADILSSIASIKQYTAGMTLEQFLLDPKTQDAVVRNLEVIGEAVKRIPEDVRKTYPRSRGTRQPPCEISSYTNIRTLTPRRCGIQS